MNFFKENWFKLTVLGIGLFVAVGIASSLNSHLNRQNQLANLVRVEKLEADKKEYIYKQKKACMDIYETEGKKFGNVREWNYSESDDTCQIIYKDPEPKSKEYCEKHNNLEGITDFSLRMMLIQDKLACLDGTFIKSY